MADGAHDHPHYNESLAAVHEENAALRLLVGALGVEMSDLTSRVTALETTTPPPPPPPPTPPSGTFLRPFSAASPWNTPAPAAGSLTDPRTVQIRTADPVSGATGINITRYSLPNYEAKITDPLVTVVDVAHGNLTVQIRVPANAVPAAGTDSNMAILQPDGWLYDLWVARWNGTARIDTQRLGRCRIDGTGCGPAVRFNGQLVPAGIRAAGCSWLGGMIRKHEIDAGVIPHALALSLPGKWLRYDPPPMYGEGSGEHLWGERGETTGPVGYGNYRGYVAPATEQDHGSAWGDYTIGAGIPMGTRFVLPKTFDISTLNPQARMMAKAAQDYGVFIIDKTDKTTWSMFYAEPAATNFAPWTNGDLTKIRQNLVVAA